VHRDIKPSNVLVDAQGRVVILDFGLVTEVADVTDEGVVGMGTLAFMAPEQWRGAAPQPADDWYAVGFSTDVPEAFTDCEIPVLADNHWLYERPEYALAVIEAVLKNQPLPALYEVPGGTLDIIGEILARQPVPA